MLIRQIVSRNLENKGKIIVNLLLKINLLIYQNIFQKEKVNISLKTRIIEIKNTKTLINLKKREKIIRKIVKKDVKKLHINKSQRNQKMWIKIKVFNQSQ